MKRAAIAILAGVLCSGSPTVQADSPNPFGFETNTHPLEYEYCKKKEEQYFQYIHFLYECRSAPRMHPDIKIIYLKFVEGVGLCFIRAHSRATLVFGKELGNLIDGLKDQIVNKYGPPTSELKEVDLEEETTLIGDKEYRYDWNSKEGFRGLGEVVSISVTGEHIRFGFRALIDFELKTSEACQKKEDELRNHAF